MKRIVLAIAGICFSFSTLGHAYSGGTGEPNNPYRISTVADWQMLTNDPCNWNRNFILVDDIDFGGANLTPVAPDIDSTIYSSFQGTQFTGVFDGNRHVLRNAVINQPACDYVGVFGNIDANGQIRNLGIEHATIIGRQGVGGLAAINYGNIVNCYSTGAITGTYCTGGLVGSNFGNITKCYSIVTTHNYDFHAGGLVGGNEGNISDSYSGGVVNGIDHAGGLVGTSWIGIIRNCYSTAAISGNYSAGGLIASNTSPSKIVNCFWDIETSGLTVSSQGKGLSTEMMKDMKTYSLNGWAGNGWTINSGNDYPRLDWENSAGQQITEPTITLEGSGTQECPYKLKSAEDLRLLGLTSILWDKYFLLSNDIDLQNYDIEPIGYDSQTAFGGVFDGNGHVISNLTIDAASFNYVGLFGHTGTNSIIKNLGIEDINVIGNSYVGGLVGCNSYGNIISCYSTGAVRGNGYAGGLVGQCQYDSVTDCHSTATVNGNDNVGGLVGYISYRHTLTNCYSTGMVSGNHYVGGVVGQIYYGSNTIIIKNCYSTGIVNGNSTVGGLVGNNMGGSIATSYSGGAVAGTDTVGGLVGYHWGNMTQCYSDGAVSGSNQIGGLIGYVSGSVNDCYSHGSVHGTNYVGGLAGKDAGSIIKNCYSAGTVSGNRYVGGIVGGRRGPTVNSVHSFWDVNSSGVTHGVGDMSSDPSGITGLTTAAMKIRSNFIGWDFVGETANGTNDIWTICENVQYPKFAWQNKLPSTDVGSDQTVYAWINGKAEVVLDGSRSSDADGDTLSYKWTWAVGADTYEANGVSPTIELPVGVHRIQLVVNDGVADSAADDVNVTVVAAIKGDLKITPQTINRGSNQPQIQAVIQLPEGIASADVDGNEPLVLYPGDITASKQWIVCEKDHGHTSSDRATHPSIFAFFGKDELMAAITANGETELKVVGRLKSGQYFYGCDTVKIIGQEAKKKK